MLFPPTAEEQQAAALAARAATGEGAEKHKAKEAAAVAEKKVAATAAAAATAAGNVSGGNNPTAGTGGAVVAGKCEVEFKNKFKGELLDLAADYLKCEATNCATTGVASEECARKCLGTATPNELIGLHNCRFRIIPVAAVIEKEGVTEIKQASPVKPAGTAATTTTPTTATTAA